EPRHAQGTCEAKPQQPARETSDVRLRRRGRGSWGNQGFPHAKPAEDHRPLLVEEVPAAFEQLERRVRQPARDVLAVAARREHVELALPQADLGADLLRLEAPGLGEGEVVVGPAADALPDRLDERLPQDEAEVLAADE